MFVFVLMIRRPPRSTRTDTLFPYTTLFRSCHRNIITACRQGLNRTYGAVPLSCLRAFPRQQAILEPLNGLTKGDAIKSLALHLDLDHRIDPGLFGSVGGQGYGNAVVGFIDVLTQVIAIDTQAPGIDMDAALDRKSTR